MSLPADLIQSQKCEGGSRGAIGEGGKETMKIKGEVPTFLACMYVAQCAINVGRASKTKKKEDVFELDSICMYEM